MEDLLIILGLILLNGLFSMSETALISARKSRLSQESKRGNKSAKTALAIAEDPDSFLSTVQIGITLIGILTGIYSGAHFAEYLARFLNEYGMDINLAMKLSQIVIVIIVTYLSIVIGELVPKRIALNSSETIAKLVARPMLMLSRITLPFVWLLSVSTNLLIRLLNLKNDETKITEGDVKEMIENGRASGEVQQVERDIMNRTLMLGDLRVGSIMTSRKDVTALNIDMTVDEIKKEIQSDLHDTYPILDENSEDVIGCISLKSLIFQLNREDFTLAKHIQPGSFVPESMPVYAALERLQSERIHCLIVCDEFGVMQGVVTLNDVLDGLVGNVDESLTVPTILKREDGSYLIDGQCPVYDFFQYFNCGELYQPTGYTTLAGLILENTRQLPKEGDIIKWHNFTFEVVDMDKLRIDKILLHPIATQE